MLATTQPSRTSLVNTTVTVRELATWIAASSRRWGRGG